MCFGKPGRCAIWGGSLALDSHPLLHLVITQINVQAEGGLWHLWHRQNGGKGGNRWRP